MFELVMTVAGKRQIYSFDSGEAMADHYERMSFKNVNKSKKKKDKKSSHKKKEKKSP